MLSRLSSCFPAYMPMLSRSLCSFSPLASRVHAIMQDVRQMNGERPDLKKKRAYLYRRWEYEQPYNREKEINQILAKHREIDEKALTISMNIWSKRDELSHSFEGIINQLYHLDKNIIERNAYDRHQAEKLQEEKNLVADAILEIDALNDAHFRGSIPQYTMNDPELIALLPGIDPPKPDELYGKWKCEPFG